MASALTFPALSVGEQVAVRQTEGLVHGFLALRTLDGTPLADGDLLQTARGTRVTSRLVFHFKDGSLQTYRVDPAASRATIHVGKAGAFSFFAGHTHEITGPIESGSVDVDLEAPSRSHVRLVIATPALKVSPAGEPRGDVPKVQEAMIGDKVLDVAHHPRITYESTAVVLKSRRGTLLDLVVTGQLTIRDVSEPVTVPVRVDVADSALTATGHFSIKQSAFGIKPISVGGVVAVKDALEIDFSISAKR